MHNKQSQSGFTLIELLVVISIIGVLSSFMLVNLQSSRESARIARTVSDQLQFVTALQLYFNDMGFYPPDINSGWDPGFSNRIPIDPDTGQTKTPNCKHCPSDWVAQVNAKWKGPYIAKFPSTTVWGGKYEYNYFDAGSNNGGCTLVPGIYFGVVPLNGSSGHGAIPTVAEQKMITEGFDADNCLNGETQLMMEKL